MFGFNLENNKPKVDSNENPSSLEGKDVEVKEKGVRHDLETVEGIKKFLVDTEKTYERNTKALLAGDLTGLESLYEHLKDLQKAATNINMKVALSVPLDMQGHEAKKDVLYRKEELEANLKSKKN